jgi:hypothetical protein
MWPQSALFPGDPVPWFVAVANDTPSFQFGMAAGRNIALCVLDHGSDPAAAAALDALNRNRGLFDVRKAAFFGVATDPGDRSDNRLADQLPGIRFFWDCDHSVTRQLGAVDDGGTIYPQWLVLDPALRVLARFPLEDSDKALRYIAKLPPIDGHAGVPLSAPVLIVPRVFEPGFCRKLIDAYLATGGTPSGVTEERNGKTVIEFKDKFKRRSDLYLTDNDLKAAARDRIRRRLVPEIGKAFQFAVTRMERYIVSCYDASTGGFFRAHRDNTTKGTAHRRFAVTINLNTEDYQGGELRFPEFGSLLYRAPTGGAVVFSCSLLHEAMPVTQGVRYAFLPFLYDDAAAKIREANCQYLDESIGTYRDAGSRR